METMRQQHLNIGGEPSGHLILGDHSTTGDALIAALQVLAALRHEKIPASRGTSLFKPVPQILKNVKFAGGDPLARADVAKHIRAIETQLGSSGRIVVRPSGTEPLLRIMIEGEDHAAITDMADALANTITQSIAA